VHQRQRGHLPRHPRLDRPAGRRHRELRRDDLPRRRARRHQRDRSSSGDGLEQDRRLVEVTRECLDVGIAAVRPGGRIRDIGRPSRTHAEGHGLRRRPGLRRHGVGRSFHSDPQVFHYDNPSAKGEILPGMTFTIEPMISIGDWRHEMWDDGWTAVTADRSRTAQFEHTLLVTDDGVEVLTVV
jgi:methionyl aminopeptidase